METGKSGYFEIAGTLGFAFRFQWSEEYDITTNTSKLWINKIQAKSTMYSGLWFPDGTISIDGKVVKTMKNYGYATHGVYVYANDNWGDLYSPNPGVHGEIDFPWYAGEFVHNSDGTKNVEFTASLNLWRDSASAYPRINGSVIISLTTIPRLSDLSADSGTLGIEQMLTVTKQAEDFKHTIKYSSGTASGTICSKSSDTNILWEPPISLAAQNTTGTSVPVTLTIETFSGTVSIGSKSILVNYSIPASVVPSVEIETSDTTGNKDKFGNYVQNKSKCKVTLTALGSQGSKIKSYSIVVGKNSSASSSATFNLPIEGIVTIKAKVTDSRGRTAETTATITVLQYENPSVSASAYRSDADGNADPVGGYMSVKFSASITALSDLNSHSYSVQYRLKGATSWTRITPTASGYTPTDNVTVIEVDAENSYEAKVVASDDFSSASSTINTVLSAYAMMHIDKVNNRIGLGKIAEGTNILDVGLNARFLGTINLEEPLSLESGGTGTDLSSVAQGRVIAKGSSGLSYWTKVPIAQGGTDASTAIDARTNLGAKIYFTLAELGITTFPATMQTVANTMPHQSVLIVDSRNIISGGAEEISDLGLSNAGMYVFLRGNSNARLSLLNIYGATSATTSYMNYGCYAATSNAVTWRLGDRQSGSYADCFYRTVDGATEWVNPPMVAGTEYRTTERWNNQVVYTKLVNCGTLTNGGTYTYHDSTVYPIRYAARTSAGIALPLFMEPALNSTYKAWVDVNTNKITARFASGYSSLQIYCQIWYTK